MVYSDNFIMITDQELIIEGTKGAKRKKRWQTPRLSKSRLLKVLVLHFVLSLLLTNLSRKKLAPKVKIQQSAIIEAILETLFKASGGQNATFCIVGPNVCFEQPQGYLNDNITEKVKQIIKTFGKKDKCYCFQLRLFTCAKKDDLRPVIKCFYEEMVKEGGIGMLMLLYSLLLSRGTDK